MISAILAWLQDNQTQAAGRNIISAVLGFVGALGVLTATQSHDLIQAWGDIQSGAAQMAKGLMVFGGIVGPIAMAWWAQHRASPSVQKQSVAALPGTVVVETDPNLRNTVALANKIAALPEAAKITATPFVADATPSDKVVAR
jgi:hypothetical protein